MQIYRTVLFFITTILALLVFDYAHAETNMVNVGSGSAPIILVGLRPYEIDEQEQQLLHNRRIIVLESNENYQKEIQDSGASQLIIRQPSGYVGLYAANGFLHRQIALNDGTHPKPNLVPPSQFQQPYDKMWNAQPGYNTGGTPNPYSSVDPYKKNHQTIAAGWGYNDQIQPRSKKDAFFDFIGAAPLDTVTPINYPGTFDSSSLTMAYGLGVIPHIGGLFAEMRRSSKNQQQYQAQTAQQPYYTSAPIQYVDAASYGDNGLSRDPNQFAYNQMPQAFNQNFPNFHNEARYYQQYGRPIPDDGAYYKP